MLELLVEQERRADERVAVGGAVTCEHRVGQTRKAPEDASLLADPQLRLEADQVVQRPRLVFLAQLQHSERWLRAARIAQPDRLHGAEGQGIGAALRHHLDRETRLEVDRLLEAVQRHLVRLHELVHERVVLPPIERDVQIVAVSGLVARGAEDDVVVQAVRVHGGRDRIVEVERVAADLRDRGREPVRGERAGRENREPLRKLGHFLAHDRDAGLPGDCLGHLARELRPVHGQRLARGKTARVGSAEDQGVEAPHLLVQKPHGVHGLIRAEAVGADELRQSLARMRRGEA